MNSKVSVIIPVYNGERTIKRAMLSVINQTYENVELVVVNDGSTDSSDAIINDVLKDAAIPIKYKVIPNGGLANARSVGWSVANGEFCCNLDADDYLEIDIFKSIFEQKKDFDICYYGFRDVDLKGHLLTEYDQRFLYLDDMNGQEAAINKLRKKIWICQGSAIYRKQIVLNNELNFIPGINQGEDMLFITSSLSFSRKVVCVNRIGVNIEVSPTSMMHSHYNESFEQAIIAIDELQKRTRPLNNELLNTYVLLEKQEQACRVCKTIVISSNMGIVTKLKMIKNKRYVTIGFLITNKSKIKKIKFVEYFLSLTSALLYYWCIKIYTLKSNRSLV